MPFARTGPIRRELSEALSERPFAVEFWDGSRIEATDGGGPTFRFRSPRAVAQALRAPGQLGLGRAYVAGELEVDDIDAVIALLDGWKPPPLERRARARLLAAALAACGLTLPPAAPRAELRPRGARRSKVRDARSVRHHYDLPPEFFALFLDRSMTYSCAIFSRGAESLEEAQEAKLELVCEKLELVPGERQLAADQLELDLLGRIELCVLAGSAGRGPVLPTQAPVGERAAEDRTAVGHRAIEEEGEELRRQVVVVADRARVAVLGAALATGAELSLRRRGGTGETGGAKGAERQPGLRATIERRRLPGVEQRDHRIDVVDVDLPGDVGAAEPELAGGAERVGGGAR